MEHESREKQTSIEFRRRKIVPGVENCTNVSSAEIKNVEPSVEDDSRNSMVSPTPEKSDRKLSGKGKQLHADSPSQDILTESLVPEITSKSTELPEKLKSLADLFDRMCSSIRLLGLKKKLPIFRNICTQVQILTKRKFSHAHLAQMKYVFPDAIQIEKVLIHDERTLCMKPDLKVNLLFDIMGCISYPGQSTSMALCHAFRIKLLEQFNANQDAEIPKAVLPEPFNQRNDIEYLDSLPEESNIELPRQTFAELDSFANTSHFSSSFRKHFCQKVVIPEAERTELLASASLPAIADEDEGKNLYINSRKDGTTSPPVVRSLSKPICIPSHDRLVERTPEKGDSTAYNIVAELTDTPNSCIVPQSSQITPTNADQVTGDVISETPSMQTPKRPIPTPVKSLVSMNENTVKEPKSTPPVRRTLMYSPQKMVLSGSKIDFGTAELTQVNLTCDATAGINESQTLKQPNSEKRQAVLDCLPAMFDTVRFICQSVDCSMITKQELVHKITLYNLDIEATSEAEEQLRLLEELVPDWICRKSAWNGEFLYCIKHLPDPNTVRAMLSEAV